MTRENHGSLMVARWGGVRVRIHLYFGLLAASSLCLSHNASISPSGQPDLFLTATLGVVILGVSVLLHEWGHWLAVERYGGSMPNLVIGPVNGMGAIDAPLDPRLQLVIYLAGPAVNLLVAVVAFFLLAIFQVPHALWLHLGRQESGILTLFSLGLQLAFAINGLLCLLNMAPSLMFDGGRALRAALLWKWPRLGVRQAEQWVANATRLVSSTLLLIIILSWKLSWGLEEFLVPLALFAAFLFFSSDAHAHISSRETSASPRWKDRHTAETVSATLRELKQTKPPPLDSDSAPAELESKGEHWQELPPEFCPPPLPHPEFRSPMSKMQDTPPNTHSFPGASEDAEEERRMDDLLVRVHHEGMRSLSSEEFAFLQKVSARYRERRQQVSPK